MPFKRIREFRKKSGLTLEMLSEKTGLDVGYLSRVERGEREPSTPALTKISAALGIPVHLLFTTSQRLVAVLGVVGEGAEIVAVEGNVDVEEQLVEPPANAPDDVACVVIRGNSQFPRYMDGERLFFVRDDTPPAERVGLECIVQLADGRMMVKTIQHGRTPGKFRLESWNAPAIEDVAVEWAAPVRWTERNV